MIDIGQQIRHVLRGVARCMPRRYQHFAEFKMVAVVHFLAVESVLGAAFATVINPGRFDAGR